MAGWCYLGGGREGSSSNKGGDHDKEDNTDTNSNNNNNIITNNFALHLPYRQNQEIYNKGLEIWPQDYYTQQHQSLFKSNCSAQSFGVGPSDRSRGIGGGFGRGGGGMNCQDCGNQAKKDCVHMRCRTCCKSGRFQCQTHVKSTWVSAAKRRGRQQQQLASLQNQDQPQHQPKSLKEVGTLPLASPTSGLEVEQFPAQVNSQAIFKCVRVCSMHDPDEQLAYQTAVNIRGHVFKGILYDQGPEARFSAGGESSSSGGSQHLGLITIPASTNDLIDVAANTSIAAGSGGGGGSLIDNPNSLHPAPINAFIAGTQFFPLSRS